MTGSKTKMTSNVSKVLRGGGGGNKSPKTPPPPPQKKRRYLPGFTVWCAICKEKNGCPGVHFSMQ